MVFLLLVLRLHLGFAHTRYALRVRGGNSAHIIDHDDVSRFVDELHGQKIEEAMFLLLSDKMMDIIIAAGLDVRAPEFISSAKGFYEYYFGDAGNTDPMARKFAPSALFQCAAHEASGCDGSGNVLSLQRLCRGYIRRQYKDQLMSLGSVLRHKLWPDLISFLLFGIHFGGNGESD